MQFKAGDQVDLKSSGQAVPGGTHIVISVEGRQVTIRDLDGRQSVVGEENISPAVRSGPIDER